MMAGDHYELLMEYDDYDDDNSDGDQKIVHYEPPKIDPDSLNVDLTIEP